MSLPEEEDRAVDNSLKLFAGLSGAEGTKIPKIPRVIRERAGLMWEKLRWYVANPEKDCHQRQMILNECRDFLQGLLYAQTTPGVPMAIRKEAYRVSRHFPLLAREPNGT